MNTPMIHAVDVTIEAFFRANPGAAHMPLRSMRAAYNRWANTTVQTSLALNRAISQDDFEGCAKQAAIRAERPQS